MPVVKICLCVCLQVSGGVSSNSSRCAQLSKPGCYFHRVPGRHQEEQYRGAFLWFSLFSHQTHETWTFIFGQVRSRSHFHRSLYNYTDCSKALTTIKQAKSNTSGVPKHDQLLEKDIRPWWQPKDFRYDKVVHISLWIGECSACTYGGISVIF